MSRLTRTSVESALRGSAIIPESKVVTLSDGTEVPFTVIPWAHHRAMEDMAIRAGVAAQMNGEAPELDTRTMGLPGVVFRSVLDHDGSTIFRNDEEAEDWLRTLSMADLQLVEQAGQWVQNATSLTGKLNAAAGVAAAATPSLADLGKASSRTTPS